MKVGFFGILALFIFLPMALIASGEVSKVESNKRVLHKKPDKEVSEDFIRSGNKLMTEYKYEKALLDFKKALLHNPFSAEAYFGLGYCYKRLGLYDKAEKELKIGLKYERNLNSLLLLGLINKYKGRYQIARDLFLEVLSEEPERKEIISYLEEMEKVDKELLKKRKVK